MPEWLTTWLSEASTGNLLTLISIIVTVLFGFITALLTTAQTWPAAKEFCAVLFRTVVILAVALLAVFLTLRLVNVIDSRFGESGVALYLVLVLVLVAVALRNVPLPRLPAPALAPILIASVLVLLATWIGRPEQVNVQPAPWRQPIATVAPGGLIGVGQPVPAPTTMAP